MRMQIYRANYLQCYQTKGWNKHVKLRRTTSHCRLLDVLSLVFDAVGVAVFTVYQFVLFCRRRTQNHLLFVTGK